MPLMNPQSIECRGARLYDLLPYSILEGNEGEMKAPLSAVNGDGREEKIEVGNDRCQMVDFSSCPDSCHVHGGRRQHLASLRRLFQSGFRVWKHFCSRRKIHEQNESEGSRGHFSC